nr:putative reverse transcriptase domain-containing protein [Tanacetum cinerariifolium]
MVTTSNNLNDNVPNFVAMINAAVANALPNLTAALRTQITNDIRNGAGPSGGDAIPYGIHVWIERLQRRWLELLTDYDTNIQYHPGKANVVTDALSRKSGMIACFNFRILHDLERLDVELCNVEDGKHTEFSVDDDGVVWFEDRLCVPSDQALCEKPLEIPMWKWDEISMDFVTCLPTTQKRNDAIWVVVDRLTKSAHFLPIRKNYGISKLAEIFRQEIVRLHGTLTSIVSDRHPRFTSRFWKGLQKAWGTRLKFSTAFHPQTDGQSKRTIQTLEDMLRACALKCRVPICWNEVGEHLIEGPELIEITNEKVAVAKEKLKEASQGQAQSSIHRSV